MNIHEKSHADKNMSTICAGLQIRRTIPYNARKAVAKVRKIQAGKGVTEREDMEKAFPPVLSDFNFVVVVLSFGKKHCLLHGGSRHKQPIPPASKRRFV